MDETSVGRDRIPIWTPDRRVRAFVSSTLAELAPEREAARSAIEALHLTPVLFELGARPHPPRALYASYLEQSDVFIGIYWERYGWVAPDMTISGLEDEYDLSARLPRLLYVKEPAPNREPELARLIGRFETDGGVSYRKFTTIDELHDLIANDLAVLLSERFGSVSPAAPLPPGGTVPTPLTPTIGRAGEISTVATQLREGARLITVTGTGGVGKTRLALTVAHELIASSAAVFFVPLSSVSNPRRVVAAIAEHVGARLDSMSELDALAAQLRGRSTILVLDNFEHLVAAAPDLIALLDRCPELQILVTSRQVLGVRGEHEFALAPLAAVDSVELFVDRAAAVRPGFTLTSENEHAVSELCRRLDGLPLALELAAARLRLLEPDELLARLGDCIDLLASAAVDLPERQRALRATLDWSFNLLNAEEKALFARLSVFAGGATLAGAEAVCGDDRVPDVLDVMASLLEKSLLIHVTSDRGSARFQMLHVVRAYAWERLAEAAETERLRERHARWFLDLVQSGDTTPEGRYGLFDVEVDNLRAVLEWALETNDVDAAAGLSGQLRAWWWLRGMLPEAIEWLRRAADLAQSQAAGSRAHARILGALGLSCEQAGLLEEAGPLVRTSLQLFEAHDDARGMNSARLALAAVLADEGLMDEAIAVAQVTLDNARGTDDDGFIEWAASILGTMLVSVGDLDAARAYQEEARDAARREGSEVYLAMAHHQLALIAQLAGDLDACWANLSVAAGIYARTPHLDGVSYALEIAAGACLLDHEVDDARQAAATAQQLHDRLRLPVWPVLHPLHVRLEVALQREPGGTEVVSEASSDPTALLERLCAQHLPKEDRAGSL